jgi:chromosomal replication initiation ATPase DnaA
VRAIKGAVTQEWIGEAPGRLPWWRLGRPPAKDEEDPARAVRAKQKREDSYVEADRAPWTVEAFLEKGAEWLGVDMDDLAGRSKRQKVVRARELLATLGVERYGLQVQVIAGTLDKHPVTASVWIQRGTERRRTDQTFRAELERLDKALLQE